MAKQKAEGGMAEAMRTARKVGPRSGFVKATFSLEPEQLAGVVAEANRRAVERGAMRSDASEVVREALVAWLGPAAETTPEEAETIEAEWRGEPPKRRRRRAA